MASCVHASSRPGETVNNHTASARSFSGRVRHSHTLRTLPASQFHGVVSVVTGLARLTASIASCKSSHSTSMRLDYSVSLSVSRSMRLSKTIRTAPTPGRSRGWRTSRFLCRCPNRNWLCNCSLLLQCFLHVRELPPSSFPWEAAVWLEGALRHSVPHLEYTRLTTGTSQRDITAAQERRRYSS